MAVSEAKHRVWEFGPFRLNEAERLLTRDGSSVGLTPKVFDTLVALVERSGHLVEKGELMARLWTDTFVEEGTLTRNISDLRKALGDEKYIETVPKRGYRFIAPVREVDEESATLIVGKTTEPQFVIEEEGGSGANGDTERPRFVVPPGHQARPYSTNDATDRTSLLQASSTGELAPRTGADADRVSTRGHLRRGIEQHKRGAAAAVSILLLASVGIGYWFFVRRPSNATQVKSIAVLSFVNEGGNEDVAYLSDGIAESLINRLSQLPGVKVIARSSSFKYKGQESNPQEVARALGVEAILTGRVSQRGENLLIGVELVDVRDKTQMWGEQYNRELTDLVTLQQEIARDVSQKLRARLSGADEQRVMKSYTANPEAYQLYLKGRYHVLKLIPSQTQKGISHFQRAVDLDPTYALAYFGLAHAYSSLALSGELPSTEWFPKAKAATRKAIEIDDHLAEAHASLGFILFWYDWDWDAAEDQFKRALELNPNSAETHMGYALLLSNTGRHAEALAEIKRAREHDPLNLLINALEGEFLLYAGQADEGLARLRNASELDANYWLAHSLAASAYIEKGMYGEAVAEARKAKELSGASSMPTAFLGYALAKSGEPAEGRGLLEGLLKLSKERYVSPYHIALIYNALDQRDETLAWLERGLEKRDPRMTYLKVEPKWNNLRPDPRFQDLLRRVGFTS